MKKKHYFTYFGSVQLSSLSGLVGALISRDIQVELNMPLFLFGFDQNVQTDRAFDLIILKAKFHIFKSELQNGKC